MILSIVPLTANAAETSGNCGDNVFWEFDSFTGVLTVFGNGDMDDYQTVNEARPWDEYEDLIISVCIEEGVTSIGARAFYGYTVLKNVRISNTVATIKSAAFMNCSELEYITIGSGMKEISYYNAIPIGVSIYYAGTVEQWYKIETKSNDTISSTHPVQCIDGEIALSRRLNKVMQWRFGVGGILTISGQGAMNDQVKKDQPWSSYNGKIKKVVIEEGVTAIGSNSFYDCDNLTDITIPNSVVSIKEEFAPVLTTITYKGNSTEWGVLRDNNSELALYIVNCLDKTVYPSGSCGENVTWLFEGTALTISGEGEMYNYSVYYDYSLGTVDDRPWRKIIESIEKVVVQEGVTSIGSYAFDECKITDVTIPNSVTEIGDKAFYDCANLSSLTIWSGVNIFGRDFVSVSTEILFQGNSDLWLTIVKNNSDSELEKYLVRCWDKTLWHSGFCGENVTYEMNLQTNCMTISGTGAMKNYNAGLGFKGVWKDFIDDIHTVVIEDGVETIGTYAFSYCSNLTSVTIPASVTKICSSAFVACDKLVDVHLPEGLVEIETNAFAACDSLGTLVIPASTTMIAPSGVSSFSAFWVNENNKYFSNDENGVLYNKNKSTLVQHPGNSKDKGYVLPETVTEISEYAFLASDNLESITLHNGVTKIGNGAFKACSNLQSVVLPNNITSIPDYAFQYCESLKGVDISYGVTTIGNYAFERCSELENINIPDSVTNIGRSAFSYCESLSDIIIPDSVTSLGVSAFAESGISNIVLGKGLTYVPSKAFYYCRYLDEIVIPENVTEIGAWAFGGSRLQKVWIPASVVEIGRSAFSILYGTELEDIYYMGTKQQWEKIKITDRYDGDYSDAKIHYSCYSKETTAPTCTEQGVVTCFCDCCNANKIGGYTAPKGHSYIITNESVATCTQHGYTKYTCEDCGWVSTDYTSNPTGHTFNEDRICETCGEKEVSTSHINNQMLSIESVLAMVMTFLSKLFGLFSVA